jgi:hypothetical protein
MAKPKKTSVIQKAKDAATWTKDAAIKVKDKSRDGLDRAYEMKKPLAQAELVQLRMDNPKATPGKIQNLLDDQLRNAEVEYGSTSVDFSSAVSLYVITSLELHELDEQNEATHQKLIDLMVILDSSAVKAARKVVGIAATAVMLLPQGKAIKGIKVAKKAIGATAAAAATAKTVMAANNKEIKIADTVISRTAKVLGPAPKAWKKEVPKPKPARGADKPPKK